MAVAGRNHFQLPYNQRRPCLSPSPCTRYACLHSSTTFPCAVTGAKKHRPALGPVPRAASADRALNDEDGISLGTMKLPLDIDIPRFENLLFQWANSLCQGANLPLPVPLKVDKIQGGVRLGFIKLEDGKTEVCVHIDCLVFPATERSGPVFRAVRNGPLKGKAPPGEQRIMRSLLQALQISVDVARL
ncbi:hypothetical protein HPP92_000945 [Vanilla planifolia]|uniref:DUF7148 domain-containing protein n=1 Tax=Vanilla planifolia TaxID=51239 RepID=A0A835S2R2_VANPL|nr:hypothetical protein HPP92_001104 [Vanilla planifolia]KAG0500873.1 hypothetical protein HPP92_000945 [Vanilla planifolia]